MDDPNEDRRHSQHPPESPGTPQLPTTTVRRLREKVTYYEKLSSPGRRDASGSRADVDSDDDDEEEQRSRAIIDVEAFEERLEAERAARQALNSPRIDVRLRSTPQSSPARRVDLPSSSSNLNVKVNVYSTPEQRPTSVTIGPISSRQPPPAPDNTTYEECIERRYDGGEVVGGARVFTFEKITLKKTVREVSVEKSVGHFSRTPSGDEHVFHDDSAYHTAGAGANISSSRSQRTSLSSSAASLSTGRFPSEDAGGGGAGMQTPDECDRIDEWRSVEGEPVRSTTHHGVAVGNLTKVRQQSTPDRRVAGIGMDTNDEETAASSQEWYNEYRTHSFQKVAAKMSYNRTNSQYDTHIKEIRGGFFLHYFFLSVKSVRFSAKILNEEEIDRAPKRKNRCLCVIKKKCIE